MLFFLSPNHFICITLTSLESLKHQKYTNLKNQGQAKSVYPYKNIGLPAPYMDKYSIKSTYTYGKNEAEGRRNVLADYLNVNTNNIETIGDTHFKYNEDEYLVYTAEEADEYAMDNLRNQWFEYVNNDAPIYTFFDINILNKKPIYQLLNINDEYLKKNNITFEKYLSKLNIYTLQDFENYLMNKTPIQDSQDKYQEFQTRLNFKKQFLTREDVFNIDNVIDALGLMDDVRKATLSSDGQEFFVLNGAMVIYKI
jgi:hypothetical protein